MEFEYVLYEVADGIATITINGRSRLTRSAGRRSTISSRHSKRPGAIAVSAA